jgi:hypothetical protein
MDLMSGTRPRRSRVFTITRWIEGFLPPAEGGQPPAVKAARARLSGWIVTSIAVVVGAAAAFVLVLLVWALPSLPSLLVGFAGGAIVGAAIAVALASRYPMVRKGGGIAILLAPLLILAAPFLLIAAAIALLRRTAPAPRAARDDEPDASPVVIDATPKRSHHKRT